MNNPQTGVRQMTLEKLPYNPLVSIVISVYNAGKYFRPSLESILGQTYEKLDIVVIDDGSTDGCIEAAEDLLADDRIRLFRQANATRPVALNRALDQIRGEFYAVQDADDISHPRRIEKQLIALLSKSWLAAAFCGHELIIDEKTVAPAFSPKSEAECKDLINAFHMPAHDPTGMFRLSLVGDMRYDAALPFVEAFDYVLRVGEKHPVIVLGECLYGYRILANSVTRRDPMRRQQFVAEALKRACERRALSYDRVFPNGPSGGRRSQHSIQDNNIAAHFISSVLDQKQAHRRWSALRTGFECARLQPFDLHYYKALVYALTSPRIIRSVQRWNGSGRS
jgi:glycosyltransferase involved in cell wall biosynthesis